MHDTRAAFGMSGWVRANRLAARATAAALLCLLSGASVRGATDATDAARPLVEKAEDLLSAGRYADARDFLGQAIAVCPSWLRPHGLLAVALQGLGDDVGARDEYATFQRGTLKGPSRAVETVAALGAELLWLVNDSRRRAGLMFLKPHAAVTLVATRHSEEMRDVGYFSHESPVPANATLLRRFMRVFGFQPALIAENIAFRKSTGCVLTRDNILATHKELMNSPGHRANILRPEVTDFGIGLAVSGETAYWVTEVFVRFTF